MTTQEAYEQIRSYFDRPGAELAKTPSGSCMYRTPEGKQCAVGCLIPSGLYDEALEDCGSWAGIAMKANAPGHPAASAANRVLGFLHDVDDEFLRRAQRLHDMYSANARAFVNQLDLLAEASGLRPRVRVGSDGP